MNSCSRDIIKDNKRTKRRGRGKMIIDKVIKIEEFPFIPRNVGTKRNEMNGKSNVEINDLMEFN